MAVEAEAVEADLAEREERTPALLLASNRVNALRRRTSWTWQSTWTSKSPSSSTAGEKVSRRPLLTITTLHCPLPRVYPLLDPLIIFGRVRKLCRLLCCA